MVLPGGPALRRLPAPSLLECGVIGDLHTAALVSVHGSIDWLCWPRFDSPSVFAALLDPEVGGRLRIAPAAEYRSSQQYEPRTNILRTEFVTAGGRATLEAFMPIAEIDGLEYGDQEVHLLFQVTDGEVEAAVEYAPRLNYALDPTTLTRTPHGILASSGSESVALSTPAAFELDQATAHGTWRGRKGDCLGLVLRYGESTVRPYDPADTERKHHRTTAYWENWCARGRHEGPWAAAGLRSALTLRLLTYAPTAALVAAVTTSLPEAIGGTRNWDYRYSWVRDASFTVTVLHGLGYAREARQYLRWLRRLLRGTVGNIGQLRVCYGLEGETTLTEMELPHLRGYLDSRPVRIGNEAAQQFQLDIFGSLAEAIYLAYQTPEGHPDEAWRSLQAIADHVVEHWQEPDHGIWEIRGPKVRYTHSALMCWVALDRAARVAALRGNAARALPWQAAMQDIRHAILTEGWSRERDTFVQSFGSQATDASLLLMPILGFLPPDDPRIVATVDRIRSELGEGPFIRRYKAPDGLPGDEGAFLICSFWMVEALARMGQTREANERFEALCRLAGPLGLFCEEVDPATKAPLGNFPQALTHLGHLQAALALRNATKVQAAESPVLVLSRPGRLDGDLPVVAPEPARP